MSEEIGYVGHELDLRVRQGQTFTLEGVLENPDGTPIDLTGSVVHGQVRRTPSDPLVALELAGTITPTGALIGRFVVELSATQTAAISAGDSLYDAESEYVYDLELTDASGRVLPVLWGVMRVFREVTRA